MTRPTARGILSCLILSAIAALTWAEVVLYSQNSLFQNDFWYPYKLNFFGGQAGGLDTYFGRASVAGNRLRSNPYIENNRILTKTSYSPDAIIAKVRILPRSYLDLIYNDVGDSFEAIRLSHDANIPSGYFFISRNGRYLERREWDVPRELFNSTLTLELKRTTSGLQFLINKKEIGKAPGNFKRGSIGYEIALNSEVYSTTVKEGNHQADLTVRNEKKITQLFFLNLAVVIFLAIASGSLIKAPLFLAISGLIYLGFDYFHYSRQHVRCDFTQLVSTLPGDEQRLIDYEKWRYQFFSSWYRVVGGKVLERSDIDKFARVPDSRICDRSGCKSSGREHALKNIKPKNQQVRILYLGGSMTGGAGLVDVADGFFDLVHEKLQTTYAHKDFESYNFSRGAFDIKRSLPEIKREIEAVSPDIILIDYVVNNPERLENFRRAIQILKEHGHKILVMRSLIFRSFFIPYRVTDFIGELEKGLGKKSLPIRPLMFDAEISKLQKDFAFEWIDPNTHIYRKILDGNIFWDSGHVTEFGHELIAESVFEKLDEMLKKRAD